MYCNKLCTNGSYGSISFIFALPKDETFGLCEQRHEKTCVMGTCENKGADQQRSNRAT